MNMTRKEATIREWWTKWPNAYVCLLAAVTSGLKVRPLPTGKHRFRKDEVFGLVVYGFRGGQIRLNYAGPVMWGEQELDYRAFRAYLAKTQTQGKRHGSLRA